MKIKSVVSLVALVCLAILAAGCSRTAYTGLAEARLEETYTGGPIHSCMVVGVARINENRILYEDAFVKAFKKYGVKAVASHTRIQAMREKDLDALRRAARDLKVQAVLITHMMGAKEEAVEVKPSMQMLPVSVQMGGYYGSIIAQTLAPGYEEEHQFVRMMSNLYETSSERLIWSAGTSTVDPKNEEDIIDSLIHAILRSLRKDGLVGR